MTLPLAPGAEPPALLCAVTEVPCVLLVDSEVGTLACWRITLPEAGGRFRLGGVEYAVLQHARGSFS